MKKTRLTKVLALTLVLMMVMSTTVFGSTVRIISNTLTATVTVTERDEKVHNVTKNLWYNEIQKAINESSSGDTIRVKAGEFTESIKIEKPIQLIGAGIGQSTLNPASGSKHTLTIGGASAYGVDLSGTVIEGFTIITPEPGTQETSAIYLTAKGSAGNEIVIRNNELIGLDNNETHSANYCGITTPYSEKIGYVKILNNTLSSFKYGMYFNSMHDILVDGNTIDDTLRNGIMFYGKPQYKCENITVTNNTLTNIDSAEFYSKVYDSGISFYLYEKDSITVSNNNIKMKDTDRDKIYYLDPADYITIKAKIGTEEFNDNGEIIVTVVEGNSVVINVTAKVNYNDAFIEGTLAYSIGDTALVTTGNTIKASVKTDQQFTITTPNLPAGEHIIRIYVVEE